MRLVYLLMLMVFSAIGVVGQTVSYTSGTITQNFNTLPSTVTTYTGGTNYNGPYELSTSANNAATMSPAINASSMGGWYISRIQGTGTGTNVGFVVGNGSGTTGAHYSFGTTGNSDRALGSLASSARSNRMGVLLTNSSTTTYNEITITFSGETWRRVTNAAFTSLLAFSYKVGATNIDDATGFTNNSALNYTAQGTITGSNTDGNTSTYRTAGITTTITGLSWAPGQVLALRWDDLRGPSGNMQAVAIDDFSFSAAVTANPNITVPSSLSEIVATSINTASTATQSFTLNSANITTDVTIAANNGFQVSTQPSSGFASSIVVNAATALTNPTIYVRYTPSVYGLTSGTISVSNTNSNNPSITVTGSVNNLAAGNLVMLGFVTSSTPDYVSFATLVDLPGGTEIKVTDRPWDGNALVNTSGDNVVTYTVPAGGLTQGTVVTLTVSGTGAPAATVGTLSGTMVLTSATGDQIFLYQGAESAPVFISGFSTSTWLTTGSTSSANSYLPASLIAGTTASNFTSTNGDAYLTALNLSGSVATLQTYCNSPANWTRAFINPIPAWVVTVLAALPTSQPTLTGVSATDNSITFNYSGGNGANMLIAARLTSSASTTPASGVTYTGNIQFGNGSALGAEFIVYSGATGSSSLTISNLSPGTSYTFSAYSFNGTGVNNNYLLSPLSTLVYSTTGIATSNSSDIIESTTFTYPTNIPYANFQENSSIAISGTSVEVAEITVRDGGLSGDADLIPTVLTGLNLAVTNGSLIRRAALYHGTTKLADVAVAGNSISFSGFSFSVADNTSANLSIRVSFNSTSIADKTQFSFTISGTSTSGTGSGMIASNAGGASTSTSGNNNRINVVANRLNFTSQPSANTTSGVVLANQPVVSAQDQFNNTDFDFTSMVTLANSLALGMINPTATANNGVATFTGFRINSGGIITLSASGGSLTSLTPSNAITVIQGLNAGDFIFIAYQTATPDRFAILAINDIPANSVVSFTDNGYNGTSNALATNEGTVTWTSPSTVLPKGTVIAFQTETTPSVSQGSLGTVPAGFALGTGGEQIIAYQGTAANPAFVAAVSSNAFITTGSTATSTSYLPLGLTNGVSALDFTSNTANGFYTGPTTLSDDHKFSFLNTAGSWTRSTSAQSWTGATWSFSFGTNSLVNNSTSISNVTLNTGQSVTVSPSVVLTISGTITSNGGSLTNNGTVTFSSPNAAIAGSANLTINNLVTVASGGTLATNGKLILGANAQLLHGTGTTGGSGTVVGDVTMIRTGGSTNKLGYNLWSTPVTGASLVHVGGSDFYTFNGATQSWTFLGRITPIPSAMQNGRGYLIAGAQFTGVGSQNGGISSFIGTPNTGTVSITVNNGPGVSDGWNFIGNPYPCNLNSGSFIAANTNLNGSVYIWDNTLSDYRTIASSPTTLIAAAQGFFVDATATGTVNFTNNMRSSSSATFYRQSNQVEEVVVKVTNDSSFNTTTIGFDNTATDGFDRMFDARKLKGNPFVALYSDLNGVDLATQVFGSLTVNRVVLLGIDAKVAGNYTISADQIQGIDPATGIFLQDALTGVMHNLRNSPYSFSVNQIGSILQRFYLHFQPLTTSVSTPDQASARIFANGNQLMVETATNQYSLKSIRMMDVSGRIVEQFVGLNENGLVRKTIQVAAGAYMVQVTLSNGTVVTQKVIIN